MEVEETVSSSIMPPKDSQQQPKTAMKRFDCYVCGKKCTHLARHLVAVHKVDAVKARGYRFDQMKTKRKRVRCPLCDREVVNLGRHLTEVEKLPRQSDDWQAIMNNKRGQIKKDINEFNIPAQLTQKEILVDYIEHRRYLQQRCTSTVKKEISFIVECLLALHRSGNLESIFKGSLNDKQTITALFKLRILMPMRRLLTNQGDQVASSHYNKLLAFSTFLKWLLEDRPLYLNEHKLTTEVQRLRATVKAAMVHFRAAKKKRTIAINKQTKPMDLSTDLPTTRLLQSLKTPWTDLTRVRDILLTILTVGSMARLGALRNMTTDQFNAAQKVEEDDDLFRVEVTDHKTMKTYGAAGVYVTTTLKAYIERYLNERPVKSKWVFCTGSGKPLTSSHASIIFRGLTRTTATQMRKSVAVAHRDSPAEIQTAISEAMLHSYTVHTESYAAKTHQRTIYKGLRAVGAVQCLQEKGPSDEPKAGTSRAPDKSSEEEDFLQGEPGSDHQQSWEKQPDQSSASEEDVSSPSLETCSDKQSPRKEQSSSDQQESQQKKQQEPSSDQQLSPQESPQKKQQQPSSDQQSPISDHHQPLNNDSWLPSTSAESSSASLSTPSPSTKKLQKPPKAKLVRFQKPLRPVKPDEWPEQYIREKQVLKGMYVPARNKFTVDQLQTAFRYLGAYRRKKSVPADLIKQLRSTFLDFDDAFTAVADKTIIDKMRAWPMNADLIF